MVEDEYRSDSEDVSSARAFLSLASCVSALVGLWRWEVAIVGSVYVCEGIRVRADKTCWIEVKAALCW